MKLDMNYRIMEKLRMMRHNNVLCDLEVYSKDGLKHRVHSCVWAAAFEDCRTLLSNKYKGCVKKNTKIELSTISADVLSTIVDFIYGEEISSIPVGLDGALKELGFHGFRYYLTNTLSDHAGEEANAAHYSSVSNDNLKDLQTSNSNCNSHLNVQDQVKKEVREDDVQNTLSDHAGEEANAAYYSSVSNDNLKDLQTSNSNCNSHLDVQDQVKKEVREDDVQYSLLSPEIQKLQEESTENCTSSFEIKLEPVESITEALKSDEESDDEMSNIKIYSKTGDDNQTVTVCVEYNCSMDNEGTDEQSQEMHLLSPSQEKNKECVSEEKAHKKEKADFIINNSSTECDIPHHNTSVFADSNKVPPVKSSAVVTSSLDSVHFTKNPPILPKFPSSQGDVVTVATFLSFAEIQKQGKTWKLQENLVPIPMSRNSTDAFNKLPIFPQCSQSKSAGEKRSRGRPKALDTEKAVASNKTQRKTLNFGTGSSTAALVPSVSSKETLNRTSSSLSKQVQKGVPVLPEKSSICDISSTSTSSTFPIQVSIAGQSNSMTNCANITHDGKPLTNCTNVVQGGIPVTSVVQTNFALPLNFSSISKPIRICQQQGGSTIFHTMFPCVDFNDTMKIDPVHSAAPQMHSHVLLNPRPTMDESLSKRSMSNHVSKQTIAGTNSHSKPTSSHYINIDSDPVFPITSANATASTPKPRILNSRRAPKANIRQNTNLKGKSLSAPMLLRTSSPASAQRNSSVTPYYREIKPKLNTLTQKTNSAVSEETTGVTSDVMVSMDQRPQNTIPKHENMLRKPRKRTRSLQNNKTLLNESVDKYILDNIKKTKRNVSSSLKIKMKSVNPQLRFLKHRKQKNMVAELFKNSVGGEIHSAGYTSIVSNNSNDKNK